MRRGTLTLLGLLAPLGACADDARFLWRNGFNTARYRARVRGGSIRTGPRRLVIRANRGSKRIHQRVTPR